MKIMVKVLMFLLVLYGIGSPLLPSSFLPEPQRLGRAAVKAAGILGEEALKQATPAEKFAFFIASLGVQIAHKVGEQWGASAPAPVPPIAASHSGEVEAPLDYDTTGEMVSEDEDFAQAARDAAAREKIANDARAASDERAADGLQAELRAREKVELQRVVAEFIARAEGLRENAEMYDAYKVEIDRRGSEKDMTPVRFERLLNKKEAALKAIQTTARESAERSARETADRAAAEVAALAEQERLVAVEAAAQVQRQQQAQPEQEEAARVAAAAATEAQAESDRLAQRVVQEARDAAARVESDRAAEAAAQVQRDRDEAAARQNALDQAMEDQQEADREAAAQRQQEAAERLAAGLRIKAEVDAAAAQGLSSEKAFELEAIAGAQAAKAQKDKEEAEAHKAAEKAEIQRKAQEQALQNNQPRNTTTDLAHHKPQSVLAATIIAAATLVGINVAVERASWNDLNVRGKTTLTFWQYLKERFPQLGLKDKKNLIKWAALGVVLVGGGYTLYQNS